MIANRNFEHCEPLTWVGRVPIYLSTALAIASTVAMILTALIQAANAQWLNVLTFTPAEALHDLRFWQFGTYAFVIYPGLMTALQIYFLAIFGRDVEKFIGRRSFAWLYALLVVATPVLLAVLSLFGIQSFHFAGSQMVQFAIFIAFVLIYPSAEIFFGIQARWIGIVLLGIFSLQMIAGRGWVDLSIVWLSCAVAVLWLIKEGAISLPMFAFVENWRMQRAQRRFRVVEREAVPRTSVHESIDPILEKIAARGIGSLTRSERERLERARTVLLEKEKTRS